MEKRGIQRVLVACRGEVGASVARRIEATGVESVALYAEIDAGDAWLDEVAYAAPLAGGSEAGMAPYSDRLRIVSAALDAGTDAVHPGTGSLARDAEFAHMVANVGLAWVGAPPAVLAACADRVEVRRMVRDAGLPVVPGSGPLRTGEEAAPWVARLGVPLRLVRLGPDHGGDAPGARLVHHLEDLPAALTSVEGSVFSIERAVNPARSVTVAVVGDGEGRALWLGEHERSLELDGRVRVRECPALALDAAVRDRLAEAALAVAGGLRLYGVGAVAFRVGADGRWWVDSVQPGLFEGYALHDLVFGVDLVASQIRLASGETLGWSKDDIRASAVAMELTVCATADGWIEALTLPEGGETSLGEGARVTVAHDPVLARIRLSGPMRHAVLVRARALLDQVAIRGLPHDTDALRTLLANFRVWEGSLDTELFPRVLAEAGPPKADS